MSQATVKRLKPQYKLKPGVLLNPMYEDDPDSPSYQDPGKKIYPVIGKRIGDSTVNAKKKNIATKMA